MHFVKLILGRLYETAGKFGPDENDGPYKALLQKLLKASGLRPRAKFEFHPAYAKGHPSSWEVVCSDPSGEFMIPAAMVQLLKADGYKVTSPRKSGAGRSWLAEAKDGSFVVVMTFTGGDPGTNPHPGVRIAVNSPQNAASPSESGVKLENLVKTRDRSAQALKEYSPAAAKFLLDNVPNDLLTDILNDDEDIVVRKGFCVALGDHGLDLLDKLVPTKIAKQLDEKNGFNALATPTLAELFLFGN